MSFPLLCCIRYGKNATTRNTRIIQIRIVMPLGTQPEDGYRRRAIYVSYRSGVSSKIAAVRCSARSRRSSALWRWISASFRSSSASRICSNSTSYCSSANRRSSAWRLARTCWSRRCTSSTLTSRPSATSGTAGRVVRPPLSTSCCCQRSMTAFASSSVIRWLRSGDGSSSSNCCWFMRAHPRTEVQGYEERIWKSAFADCGLSHALFSLSAKADIPTRSSQTRTSVRGMLINEKSPLGSETRPGMDSNDTRPACHRQSDRLCRHYRRQNLVPPRADSPAVCP
jgi:hypothetical protein